MSLNHPIGKLKDLQRPIRYSLFQWRRSKVQLLTCAEGHDQTTEEKGNKKLLKRREPTDLTTKQREFRSDKSPQHRSHYTKAI